MGKWNCVVVGRFPPHPLLSPSLSSSSQVNEEGKLQYSNSLHGSAAHGDWKCQQRGYCTSHNKKITKNCTSSYKIQSAPQPNQAALDYSSNTTQETFDQLPRWSNFVSPILGIRAEHERSSSTNHHIPTASAPCSAVPWRKSLRLFLSLFKMGAKLVTYHKGVFS